MTDNNDEHLSAFFDGELDEPDVDRVAERLTRDDELTLRWERYQLIGDAIRGQLPQHVSRDLASRIRASVSQEPAILASPRSRKHRYTRHAAGVALAASVAGAALLLFPVANENPGVVSPRIAQQDPQQFFVRPPGLRWSTGEPAVASKLNRYLVIHNELARQGSIKGTHPDARLVGYEQSR